MAKSIFWARRRPLLIRFTGFGRGIGTRQTPDRLSLSQDSRKGAIVTKKQTIAQHNYTKNGLKNYLYYGDNLDVLRRKIADDSIDLCYIDPPFNSKRNYFQIYNNQGSEDRAQAQAFIDTWEWGDEAESGLAWITDIRQLQNGKLELPAFAPDGQSMLCGVFKGAKRASLRVAP